jgi:hemin uptake protein HemP
MNTANDPKKSVESAPREPSDNVVVEARQLFQGNREICIEHEGVRYRLRITRRNKLILQK